MTDSEAIAKAQKERDMARYLSETSPYPGIQAVHRNKYEWLSCIIRLAQKTLNDTEKPNTRADRIRAMSDEELTKHFSGMICDINEGVEYHASPNTWLEWLKRPVEEGADNDNQCPCDSCPSQDSCDGWDARFCCTLCQWHGMTDCDNCDPMDI